MDGHHIIHIMNTNEVEGLADPSLQQYECSLYTEKGIEFEFEFKFLTHFKSKFPINIH